MMCVWLVSERWYWLIVVKCYNGNRWWQWTWMLWTAASVCSGSRPKHVPTSQQWLATGIHDRYQALTVMDIIIEKGVWLTAKVLVSSRKVLPMTQQWLTMNHCWPASTYSTPSTIQRPFTPSAGHHFLGMFLLPKDHPPSKGTVS